MKRNRRNEKMAYKPGNGRGIWATVYLLPSGNWMNLRGKMSVDGRPYRWFHSTIELNNKLAKVKERKRANS